MIKRHFLCLAAIAIFVSCSKSLYVSEYKPSQTRITSEIVPDSAIVNYYIPYKMKLDSQMNSVIGYSEVEMVKRQPESELGNFFADAVAQTVSRRNISFDFAMPSTNGGMRTSVPKGNVTLRNIYELMPFENELVILSLKGSDVKSLANFIVARNGQPISGMQIKADNKQLSDVWVKGQKIDDQKIYLVLTSDYLAGGGDGIEAFKNAIKRDNLSIKVRDAIIEYIQVETNAGRTLNPVIDGRVNIQ